MIRSSKRQALLASIKGLFDLSKQRGDGHGMATAANLYNAVAKFKEPSVVRFTGQKVAA